MIYSALALIIFPLYALLFALTRICNIIFSKIGKLHLIVTSNQYERWVEDHVITLSASSIILYLILFKIFS